MKRYTTECGRPIRSIAEALSLVPANVSKGARWEIIDSYGEIYMEGVNE